jgi:hypothetical protein
VNRGFTPRMIAALEVHVRELTVRIVEDAVAKGECDFVVDVAAELPLEVIAELLGVPREDRFKLFDWSNRMIGSEDPEALGRFYGSVLGAPTWEDQGFIGWQLGGAGLMIGAHSEVKGRNEMPGRVIWNLETPDVRGEFERIKGGKPFDIARPWFDELLQGIRQPKGAPLSVPYGAPSSAGH